MMYAEPQALHALLDRGAAPGPDQQCDLAVGNAAQEALEQVRAEEAGGAGDEDALAGQLVTDHTDTMSTIW